MTANRISYTRPLTEREGDILTVAAEVARTQLDDRIPEDVAATMRQWAGRLKLSVDEIKARLRVKPEASTVDERYPCADWCCSKGCPGPGNALCDGAPCDGSRCTCGQAAIRAEIGALRARVAELEAGERVFLEEWGSRWDRCDHCPDRVGVVDWMGSGDAAEAEARRMSTHRNTVPGQAVSVVRRTSSVTYGPTEEA